MGSCAQWRSGGDRCPYRGQGRQISCPLHRDPALTGPERAGRFGSGGQVFAAGGDGELAVLDAFSGDEFVGNLLDGPGLAAHGQDFQAVVVVQVDVQRGNDDVMVVVLDVGERGLDVLLVVVVNQGDGACDVTVAVILVVFDKLVPDHVGHRQGAVIVALFTCHPVKLFGQLLRHGDSEP